MRGILELEKKKFNFAHKIKLGFDMTFMYFVLHVTFHFTYLSVIK